MSTGSAYPIIKAKDSKMLKTKEGDTVMFNDFTDNETPQVDELLVDKANKILNEIIAEIESEASSRLKPENYEQTSSKMWGKWLPKFFGIGAPVTSNSHMDKLCYKYGLYGYADRISPSMPEPSPLLWFEQFPTAEKTSYLKKVKKRTKKSSKFARKHGKLVKKYEDIAPLYETKNETPDYERAAQVEKKRSGMAFDTRETLNLDFVFPIFAYMRICSYREQGITYPSEFKNREEFMEKKLDEIQESLEFNIVMHASPLFDSLLDQKTADLSNEDMIAVKFALRERSGSVYRLLGLCIPDLWF